MKHSEVAVKCKTLRRHQRESPFTLVPERHLDTDGLAVSQPHRPVDGGSPEPSSEGPVLEATVVCFCKNRRSRRHYNSRSLSCLATRHRLHVTTRRLTVVPLGFGFSRRFRSDFGHFRRHGVHLGRLRGLGAALSGWRLVLAGDARPSRAVRLRRAGRRRVGWRQWCLRTVLQGKMCVIIEWRKEGTVSQTLKTSRVRSTSPKHRESLS